MDGHRRRRRDERKHWRRSRDLGAALAVVLLGLAYGWAPAASAAEPDPGTLRLNAATFDPRVGRPALPLPALEHHPAGVRGGYLVQFDHPIGGADREALEQLGVRPKGFVPMRALEVVMTEAQRASVAALPGVRWVGVYEPGYKVSAELMARTRPPHDPGRRIPLAVTFLPGEDAEALAQLRGLGIAVRRFESGRSYALAELDAPAARIVALARLPLVRRVEMRHERIPLNDRVRFHTGLAAVADDTFSSGLDPSLDGSSGGFQIKYGHNDGGLWSAHPDFQTSLGNGWLTYEPGSDPVDSSGHGTHTAGILIGDGGNWSAVPETPPGSGSVSANRWRGIQPEAALHHISFENNYSDREIFERESEEGAHISTNSWGYADCPLPPFLCLPIAAYNANAVTWDEGVWDADDDATGLQALTVVFAAGNFGLGGSDGCLLFSGAEDLVSSPSTAKNVITVGANESERGCGVDGDNLGDLIAVSSRGPVDPDGTGQGLYKPDLVAPGGFWVLSTERDGTGGVCDGSGLDVDCPTSCSDSGGSYRYAGGTSMAAPAAAGTAGVLFQDLVTQLGTPSPKPSLIKALLINGALALQPSGTCSYDFETESAIVHQGWGMVRADRSLYGEGGTPLDRKVGFENEVTDDALATGEVYQRTVTVGAGAHLKVSLVWTDYPAVAGSGSPLVVNDLDLEVSGPDGLFFGNNFSGVWSVPSTVQAVPDRYNVVENVYLQTVLGGSYTITVRGHQVSQDQEPDKSGVNQDFSLVWSSPAVAGACDDGLDNDGDGETDLDDPGCDDASDLDERSPLLVCDDGIDNDSDGLSDFHPDPAQGDPGCRDPEWTLEDPKCDDGMDNDSDGGVDWDGIDLNDDDVFDQPGEFPPDLQCTTKPWKNREQPKVCGLGFELALLLPGLLWLRRCFRSPRA